MNLEGSLSRGDLLRQAIFLRARDVVPSAKDPYAALQADSGIRSLLESAIGFSDDVTYAAIVNREGVAVAHSSQTEEGQRVPDQVDLSTILNRSALSLLQTVYTDQTFEMRQPVLFGDQEFATIKIGIST